MQGPEYFTYLSAQHLESLNLSAEAIIQSIEQLLTTARQSHAWNAPKSVIMPDQRYLMATLSAADDPPFLAVKALILNPRNHARGLADINALVTLLDSDTGVPLAIIDGNWVTAVRTAGLSAVAAKRLAKPDASVIAFIGCGVQARSHLKLFAQLFPLRELRAFGRGASNRNALCQLGEALGLRSIASESARAGICDADLIISTVTFSTQLVPFLDARWLKPGAFATVTDLAAPWIKQSFSELDYIVIDDREQEAVMETPLINPHWITGDLTELVCDVIKGRSTDEQKTAFIFRGLALGDLALSALAYQTAQLQQIGFPIKRE